MHPVRKPSRRGILSGSSSLALAAYAQRLARAAAAERVAPPSIKSFAAPFPTFGSIERVDPAFDALVPKDARIEKLAEGFAWTEGPLWIKKGGYLLFSDIPPNTIYKWKEGYGTTIFMQPSGYHGDRKDLKEGGTNGLALDRKGDLLMAAHGDRRLARLASWADPQGKQIALADRYDGKRFNSPNDLVLHPSGDLFFTDPPYGLPKLTEDPEKELKFQGVFRLDPKGEVTLIDDQLERPNGIGLSPDGKTLYAANSHGPRPVVVAYALDADRKAGKPRVLFDGTELAKQPGRGGAFDGMAVDKAGNLWCTGLQSVVVLSPEGRHLGSLVTGRATANCKFGDDGRTLYITAEAFLARVKTTARG
jgi:gluconolactonase